MDPTTPLATNLKRIRIERGWTHADAAAATGFDAEVLEGIERGSTFISRARADLLAERLRVPPAELRG